MAERDQKEAALRAVLKELEEAHKRLQDARKKEDGR